MKNLGISIGVLMLLLLSSTAGAAQSQIPKFEVGAHIFSFQSKELGTGYGLGGRFTYNLTRNIAIDTEFNSLVDDEGKDYAHQGFAGAKIGVQNKYAGVFFKARPGFMTNFAKPAPNYATTFAYQSLDRFAFDVGGVIEGYPTKHLVLRVDLGDLIIPFGKETVLQSVPFKPGTTHNFQYSLGLGLRF
jgi:hypothetical protein